MTEKRKRMVLNSQDMPDEVYNILNEKALRRSLTPYIIELVKKSIDNNSLLEKINIIESKIDNILAEDIVKNNINLQKNNSKNEENILNEGLVVESISQVVGGIDEDDKVDYDF